MGSYYHTDDGKIKEELLDKKAEEVAKKIFIGGRRDTESTRTQIRKFYNEVKYYEKKIRKSSDEDSTFKEIFPLMKMLKAKVAYTLGRTEVKISQAFYDEFVRPCIDRIEDREDFYAFVRYFEAVIGYGYYYSKGKKEENLK
ncbi:MAG: type III-A CRISPR-associated protein Csm2 [Actinobacteria bacterium]|nr:type III-A CRISPR-associated protein Csm2 [Actinomycetota bacterium]